MASAPVRGRPQGRRTQAQRTAATRAALLEATVDCLVAKGLGGTTTAEVARRAGVSPGALLHHFPAKVDLLCAAVGHLFDMRRAEFQRAVAALAPGTDLTEVGIDLLWTMFSGDTFVAWIEIWVGARTDPSLAAAVARLQREFMDSCVEIYRQMFPARAAEQPDLPRVAVGMVFALLDGLAVSRLVDGYDPIPADAVIALFKAMVQTVRSVRGESG